MVEKLKNLPVYCLKPESGMGRVRTLHRDHILAVGDDVRLTAPAINGSSGTTKDKSTICVKKTEKWTWRDKCDTDGKTIMRVTLKVKSIHATFTQTGWKNSHTLSVVYRLRLLQKRKLSPVNMTYLDSLQMILYQIQQKQEIQI